MKAVAYTRVSTEDQADSKLGLEAQRADIIRAAVAQGLDIVDWYSDPGISGAEPLDARPGLQAAFARVSPNCVLIVAKWDRLSRDKLLSGWLEKETMVRNSRIISAAGEGTEGDPNDPMAFMVRTMIQMFAHWERLMIRARTRAALQSKRVRREALGNTPFGYMNEGGRLVPNPAEVAVLARMRELAAKYRSYALIGRLLTKEGLGPRQLGWNRRTVGWLLTGRLDTLHLELASRARGVIASMPAPQDGKPRDYREIARTLNRAGIPPPPARWSSGAIRALLNGGRSVTVTTK